MYRNPMVASSTPDGIVMAVRRPLRPILCLQSTYVRAHL
ncbi:hypothetical protein AHF37_12702 [Paragonimus kellicotti]|nr:hypothetical protein AHF37_12702 [Paragonimus kellicotti]